MSTFAFCNYIRFLQRNGTPTAYAYQNFSINQTRTYSGVAYPFLSFAVSTGAGAKGGDRVEASLAAGANAISVNVLTEAAMSGWLVEIKSVALDPLTFTDGALIRTETWRAARPEIDTNSLAVVLRLTSPLDAVREQVPGRFLTTRLVGALPTSASLVVS